MSNNKLDNNTEMEIPVFETPPGPGSSAIKVEPKEENCEDLLSAFLLDPPSVKIENEVKGEDLDEFGTLSEDYTVNIEQLKAEQSEDSKEWLNKHPLKSEEKDQLPVGEDQDDDFVENPSIIKSEEMDIKEDESINEPGILPNTYDHDEASKKIRKTVLHQCPKCEFRTPVKRDMTRHLARHDRKPTPTCKQITNFVLHQCPDCEFKSTRKRDMSRHLARHNRKQAFLKAHSLRHISSEQASEYKCDMCKYTTLYKGHIERHVRSHTKTGEGTPQTMFGCNQCDFKTKYKENLKVHSLLHENRENTTQYYCCPKCDYTTTQSQKENMKIHLLVHSQPEDVNMLKCDQCSYVTMIREKLIDHLDWHKKNSEQTPSETRDSQNAEAHQQTAANVLNSVDYVQPV